jgi:hypothetical protein
MEVRIEYAAIGKNAMITDFYSLGASKSCSIQKDVIANDDFCILAVRPRGHGMHGSINQNVISDDHFSRPSYRKLAYDFEILSDPHLSIENSVFYFIIVPFGKHSHIIEGCNRIA